MLFTRQLAAVVVVVVVTIVVVAAVAVVVVVVLHFGIKQSTTALDGHKRKDANAKHS